MLDWNRVDNLRYEIGEEDFLAILSVFLEETDAMMATIDARMPAIEMARVLHFLKGSAVNIGLASFAQACQQAERDIVAGVTTASLDGLKRIYRETRAELLRSISVSAA